MANGLTWFKFPVELLHSFTLLDENIVGAAMKAVGEFSKYGVLPGGLCTSAERLFFDVKLCLEESRKEYEAQVERNTANARKGAGRPQKAKKNQADFKPISIGNQADFKPIADTESDGELDGREKNQIQIASFAPGLGKGGSGGNDVNNLQQSADFEERRNAGIAKLQAYQATKNGGDFN